MNDTNDTIADIIAEMRRNFADGNPYYAAGLPDRLEAAHKRERGNAAKLREALALIATIEFPHNFQNERFDIADACQDLTNAIKTACAALAAPPRNCDVGTAEEQSKRFDQVCSFRFTGNCAGCKNPLDDSAANGVSDCALFWAQMPYDEEGGAK